MITEEVKTHLGLAVPRRQWLHVSMQNVLACVVWHISSLFHLEQISVEELKTSPQNTKP